MRSLLLPIFLAGCFRLSAQQPPGPLNDFHFIYGPREVVLASSYGWFNLFGEHSSQAVPGTRPFEYQWNFEGAPIPGATRPSLVIPRVESRHAGKYGLIIRNPWGSVTNNNLRLAVVSFETQVTPEWWLASDPIVRITAKVAAADDAKIGFRWQRNGVNIPGSTNAALDVHVFTTDAGAAVYRCYIRAAGYGKGTDTTIAFGNADVSLPEVHPMPDPLLRLTTIQDPAYSEYRIFQLTLMTTPGSIIGLEMSDDLKKWQEFKRLTASAEETMIEPAIKNPDRWQPYRKLFYRARPVALEFPPLESNP